MATLTMIAGLPGSGKSHLVDELRRNPGLGVTEPDFMKDSIENLPQMRKSQHYERLLADLSNGVDCVIADIVFVRADKRQELANAIEEDAPGTVMEWICYENDWLQCLKNVRRRAEKRGDLNKFVKDGCRLLELTIHHSIPDGAEVKHVWRSDE